MQHVFNLFPSFPFSFVCHFVLHNSVNFFLIKMVLEKNLCLQLTKMETKNDPLYILSSTGHCLYQRMSNVPLAYV